MRFVIPLALILAGCDGTRDADFHACKYEVNKTTLTVRNPWERVLESRNLIEYCMEARGYTLNRGAPGCSSEFTDLQEKVQCYAKPSRYSSFWRRLST